MGRRAGVLQASLMNEAYLAALYLMSSHTYHTCHASVQKAHNSGLLVMCSNYTALAPLLYMYGNIHF
jgi:hypothetical protein